MSTINTNVSALNAARTLNRAQDLLSRSLGKLSSGTKIGSPADDAAGLAVASKLDAQNLRLSAASTNVQNAVSYVQTADGFIGSMGGLVTRLSELVSLAQDPTKSPSDVSLYQQEFSSLQSQLRATIGGTTAQIGGTTDIASPLGSFNGQALFGATTAGGKTLSIGADGQALTIPDTDLRSGNVLSLINQDSAGAFTLNVTSAGALATITGAIQQLASSRATLGASESRLNLAATTLQVEGQNLASTLSGIRDVDVANESTQYARYNILVQSGTAMLAQANQSPQSVLKLLQAN
jgi:flagellin